MPLEPVPDRGEIRFQTYRDAGSVLNATFAFLRQNAREVFVGFLAIVAPVYLASAVVQALYLARLQAVATDPAAVYDAGAFVASVLPSALGIGLLGFFASVVGQAAAGAYVRLYRDGLAGEITVGALWDETKSLILPLAGLNLVVGLAVLFVALINFIPCLGQIVFFGFLVWVFPILSVMVPARVLDSESVGEAWERARGLVKGSWGFAFGALLLAIVVLIVISIAVAIPAQAAAMAAGVNLAGEDPEGALPIIQLLFAPLQLVTAAAYLVPFVTAYFVHGRLVEELEGTSVNEGLDALAAPSPDATWADERVPLRSTPPSAEPPPSPASGPDDGPDDGPEGGPDPEDGGPPRSGFRGGGFGGGA